MHDFQHGAYDGRYIRFGVREHGMAAIINGIACHTWADVNPKTHKDSQVPLSGLLPFGATFLNFIGYALGAVRLSAVSHCHVLYIATHDSIGLGEDGPTHQPIEMLASLRSLPNMLVFRPCDGNETSGAYFESCFVHTHQPSLLALSRQEVPTLEGSSREKVAYGGYTLKDYMSTEGGRLDLVLAGTGTEVSLCVDVAKVLSAKGHNVRVVSMPCLELFDAQPREYRASVLPEGVPVMSVEALATYGWNKYSHVQCGMRTFGASGPYKQVYDKFGLTAPKITERALKVVEHYRANPVPTLEVLMEQL
jgi:transketolase